MTKQEQHEKAEKIALEHGCELQPTAFRGAALVILRKYQQGGPLDEARLANCRAALATAGVLPYGLVS